MLKRFILLALSSFALNLGVASAQSGKVLNERNLTISMTCLQEADVEGFSEVQRDGRYVLMSAPKSMSSELTYRLLIDYFPCFYDVKGPVNAYMGSVTSRFSEPTRRTVEIDGDEYPVVYSMQNQIGIVKRLKKDCGANELGGMTYPDVTMSLPFNEPVHCKKQILRILDSESTELHVKSHAESGAKVSVLIVMGSPYIYGSEFGKW